jgi:hypothetical protein
MPPFRAAARSFIEDHLADPGLGAARAAAAPEAWPFRHLRGVGCGGAGVTSDNRAQDA